MRPAGVLAPASIILFLAASAAAAQSGGGYDLSWSTADAGGGTSSGGAYSVSGTIGQPDAGTLTSADSRYTLHGGFWGLRTTAVGAASALVLLALGGAALASGARRLRRRPA
jgi:hypothetical protein